MARKKAEIRVRCHLCFDEYDIVISVGKKVFFEGLHDWWEKKPYAIRAAKKLSKETSIPFNDKILNEAGC